MDEQAERGRRNAGVTLIDQGNGNVHVEGGTLDQISDVCYENLQIKIEALISLGEIEWNRFKYRNFIDSFDDVSEKLVAIYLVNSVIFLSENFCESSLSFSLNKLMRNGKYSDNVKFLPISGSSTSTVDSGYRFISLIRKMGRFMDDRYFPSLDSLLSTSTARSSIEIIFVDDIMSTGQQFDALMNKSFTFDNQVMSLNELRKRRIAKISYVPIIATEYALERFDHLESIVFPCYTLNHEYNILNNLDRYFPSWLLSSVDVLETIKNIDGKFNRSGLGLAGQGNLALSVAFFNSTPDSSLPLLWSSEASEVHLLRRHS
ncbi:phosphoribosyltransferase-like protein [Deinococcus marmoris]|uniref:phosphoribosyltransferase-like protein n=1 Tax=Deinococcus marmoris TaxID=249408 RepID=UPI0011153C8B|nr:hypothetical protein [Deinococcus marmoris]